MATADLDTDQLVRICCENDATMVGLFGSAARGEATADSDIDLVVRFSKPKSLLELVRLERRLSTRLKRKVDLLTQDAISPYLRETIMQDMKIIYEAA